ncbi:hypothetical protein V6N13_146829 [Hibiscus sabdariffa]
MNLEGKLKESLTICSGEKEDFYELWHACAGLRVYVPPQPQGHMEQVDACMNQDGTMEMPIYDMPYRILCTVMHVRPKVERSTDEVFAYKLSTFTPRKLVHSSLVRNSLRLSCSKQKAGTDDASYSSPVFSSLLIDTQQLYSVSACCMVQLSSNLEVAQGSCKVKKIVTQIVEISVRVPKNAHQSRGRNRKAES